MVVNGSDGDLLPVPRPRPRWKLRITLSVLVVAALVAGGLKAYDWYFVRCDDGVRERGSDGECVGVTDGGYSFDDSLDSVMGKIHEENKRVGKSGERWVSVAYVEPMTLGPGDKGRESIRQAFEGAYLAQRELNHHPSGGHGTLPQIKLLPANPGRGVEQWRPVVDQLDGMTDDEHPLVGVAGFGQSLKKTGEAVEELRKRGVPMVGSTVTADGLSDAEEPAFFRAASPNSEQTRAVAKYLKGEQDKKKGFRVQVVKDRNRDDTYSNTLREGFEKAATEAGLKLDPATPSFLSRGQAVNHALAEAADKVCGQGEQSDPPDAVYFAGRGRDIKGFIEGAGADGRSCPVTVYNGDDAVGLFFDIPWDEKRKEYEQFRKTWERSKVQIKYTALAHPDASQAIYKNAGPYQPFRDAYADTFGGHRGLLNGQAMLAHDAVRVLGEAIRDAAGDDGDDEVTKQAVRQMLLTVSDKHALDGVSGKIDFDDKGDPRKKLIPLVQLVPGEREGYDFLRLLRS